MSGFQPLESRSRTKIVATIGPACQSREMLEQLVTAGVDICRLNMAHGSREDHQRLFDTIREVEQDSQYPIGILVDLAGPKIRLGELSPNPLPCIVGQEFTFVREAAQATAGQLTSNYQPLIDELTAGDRVLMADGTIEMTVVEKTSDQVRCCVVQGGDLRSRQGINLPGVQLSAPAMSEVDRDNARWAAMNGADFISLSFVRSADDIRGLRSLLEEEGGSALTIAKIEKPEALENLEDIVKASHGIMVARGDLGVEIDVATMPVAQKNIIDACSTWKRPVIVATQMLDSMQRASRPTRAEVTDVANAILDGTDACMLSGETAIGQYPIESVRMMNRIMKSIEENRLNTISCSQHSQDTKVHEVTSAVVRGAGGIAAEIAAKIVVVATRSGATALTKAKERDLIRTVAVSDCQQTLRQMSLYWGIHPLPGAPDDLEHRLVQFIVDWGLESGHLIAGDRVVFVTGTGVKADAHNLLMIHEIAS
ncbi:MAG: pyruvate kinase [Pirellulaceae bacterium]|nr:pyruvate kinase [Pirellulaceae bacterium]